MGNDEMKQDSMGHDSMKHDEVTEGKKQKKPTSPRSQQRGRNGQGWNEARRQRETKRQYAERGYAARISNTA